MSASKSSLINLLVLGAVLETRPNHVRRRARIRRNKRALTGLLVAMLGVSTYAIYGAFSG